MDRAQDHQFGAADVLAVDLGGTRTKVALVRADGEIAGLTVLDTPPSADAALAAVLATGRAVVGAGSVGGVGLCVPGLVDEGGCVVALPGKLDGIVGRDLVAELSGEFGAAARVMNDAIAYGAGEARVGAGAGYRRVVVMTIGTGVGVAVFDHGEPVTSGTLGGGLQGGQIPLPGGDPRWLDTSDHHDTLEALCRAQRLVDYTVAAGATVTSAEEVFMAYTAGEAAARAGVERFRAGLVNAVRALANAHGADAVIVGGGPLTVDGPLLGGVEDAVQAQLWPTHRIVVRRAVLGDTAALVGLATLCTRP